MALMATATESVRKGLGSPAFYKLEAELDEDHPRVKKIIQEFDRVVPNCVF
ncbi:hypothetical protein HanOQP8_Chr12g0435941 [Helianthus annuus]|nr:hypothetical protein HanOQP8_Chr12g0435941 [Helianthus annuus]